MICTRQEIHGQECPENPKLCPVGLDGFVCPSQVHYIKKRVVPISMTKEEKK
jgi:hypothetical protein